MTAGQDQNPNPKPGTVNQPAAAERPRTDFVRQANLISRLTLLSRLFGLVRDKACAYFLGVGTNWSAFWMGFQFPNLFRRIFGEGALTAVFLPVYVRVRDQYGQTAANQVARAVTLILIGVLTAITLAGETLLIPLALAPGLAPANRLAAAMIALMLPYSISVCAVALLGAMAAAHERFAAQAAAPIILNVAMALAAAIPVWWWSWRYPPVWRVACVAMAVLLAGSVQLLMMAAAVRRAGVHLGSGWRILPTFGGKIVRAALRDVIRPMTPMILGLSAVQLNTFFDSQIAWWFSPDGHNGHRLFHLLGLAIHTPMLAGALGKLSVAQRIYLLPVGIFGVATATALFPSLAAAAAAQRRDEIKRLLNAALRKSLFLSLPSTAGMILIAPLLIAAIYLGGRVGPTDVARAAWAARWFCAGIWAFELQMILVRVFYAQGDAITPMKIAAAMVALNLALNLTFIWFMQEGGIAASTSLSAAVQVMVLAGILRHRLGAGWGLRGVAVLVAKCLLAVGLMVLAVLALNASLAGVPALGPGHRWPGLAVRLLAAVLAAVLVYGLASRWLHIEELAQAPVLRVFRRRAAEESDAGAPRN